MMTIELNLHNSQVGDHQQAEGMMMYDTLRNDEGKAMVKMFGFQPNEDEMMDMESYSGSGSVRVSRDGTVDVLVKRRIRNRNNYIKRTAHGRVSLTADGAIQLTLKFFLDKEANIAADMKRECAVLIKAVKEFEDKI